MSKIVRAGISLVVPPATVKYAHLLLGVAELVQVVDAVEDGALEGHGGVQVVLAAALIHGQPLKYQPLREARLQGADLKYGIHVQLGGAHGRQILLHAAPVYLAPASTNKIHLDAAPKSVLTVDSMHGGKIFVHGRELMCSNGKDVEQGCALELQESAHFDGATEGHFAVALAEMHVAHRQLGALHKHYACSVPITSCLARTPFVTEHVLDVFLFTSPTSLQGMPEIFTWEVDLAALCEILDVTVAAVLAPAGATSV